MSGAGPTIALQSQAITIDVFLGGRLAIRQPATGYRAGLDAVLLAASMPAPAVASPRVLDAGAGVGVVGLCVAARIPDARVTLVELQPQVASLAHVNAAENGFANRVTVIEADICAPHTSAGAERLVPDGFDCVLANPPYLAAGRGRSPPDPAKARAFEMEPGGLERWARFLARMAAPGGALAMIHRADALKEVLEAIDGRFGAIEVIPLHPRANEPAHRILVHGIKGSRAPLTLRPGVVLHGPDGRFMPAIKSVLRDGAALMLGR